MRLAEYSKYFYTCILYLYMFSLFIRQLLDSKYFDGRNNKNKHILYFIFAFVDFISHE